MSDGNCAQELGLYVVKMVVLEGETAVDRFTT